MLSGFTTWPLRDIIMVAVIIFNAGGLVYLSRNHMSHMRKSLDEIFMRLRKLEQQVSYIKGKLDE